MVQSKSQALQISHYNKGTDEEEMLWRSLAANIAKDILPLEDILKAHGISIDRWDTIKESRVFKAMLVTEMQLWASADNTPERIKLKYLSMIEQSAPEFFEALVDTKYNLGDRTKLLQTIMRGANIGQDNMDAAKAAAAAGNRVSIQINLGGGTQLSYDKDLPPRVIDNNINRQSTVVDYSDLTDDGDEVVEEVQDEDEIEEETA